jgi:hypothetical protein
MACRSLWDLSCGFSSETAPTPTLAGTSRHVVNVGKEKAGIGFLGQRY